MDKIRKSTCQSARTNCDRDTILLREEKAKRLRMQALKESKECENSKPAIGDFDIGRLLGNGGYGKVFLARHRSSAELLAIKVLKVSQGFSLSRLRTIEKERKILQQNNHPFLVGLHYAFHINNGYCLVMEYLEGGDLWTLLTTFPLPESSVRFYSSEIIIALSELHRRHIVYIDLKLENIMLDRQGHIRLVDYGLCIEDVSPGNYVAKPHYVGTVGYLSPETYLDLPHGRPVDWWAFGILMYEMLHNSLPFTQELDMILDRSGFPEPKFNEFLSPEAVSILKGLLTNNYLQRLGSGPDDAKEIQCHDFFKDVNWDDVLLKKVPPPHEPKNYKGRSEGNESKLSMNDGYPCLSSLRLPLFTFQRERDLRKEDDEVEIMT